MDINDLANRFTYHPPKDETTINNYAEIRNNALNLAVLINARCPDSSEKSLAITHLEDCVMWANASIARNE